MDSVGVEPEEALFSLSDRAGEEDDAAVLHYAEVLVRGVSQNRSEIDRIIQEHSPNWRLERMARVDRNVLRIATFELMQRPDVPHKVVINEAIEVAKRFGTEESGAFINGLLDKVAQEIRSGERGD